MERAIGYQALLDAGKLKSRAALARREGVSRARITQVMTLLRLAPGIQGQVLAMAGSAFSERGLRGVAMIARVPEQVAAFEGIGGVIVEESAA